MPVQGNFLGSVAQSEQKVSSVSKDQHKNTHTCIILVRDDVNGRLHQYAATQASCVFLVTDIICTL